MFFEEEKPSTAVLAIILVIIFSAIFFFLPMVWHGGDYVEVTRERPAIVGVISRYGDLVELEDSRMCVYVDASVICPEGLEGRFRVKVRLSPDKQGYEEMFDRFSLRLNMLFQMENFCPSSKIPG
ncbi:hypothetical protein A3B18_03030 [Candidatus Giovannonibacteria bacterium RIFCSPLOWO2_01_FULL_46_13]|uniref:Uncharacterized protein n=1 Tax=Candidatus Giovannonibacteria bacterium RIFCSPLOWO2_01_FULL_46_13 TaxID=1798352 RepID=A0A1F5X332_9BACT|nr:MAG: hypothetical protein A3B18_03030 [Candidatus Giovannonibacteria bacterium RIFCSPLOWO2_01_FULL_46_13]